MSRSLHTITLLFLILSFGVGPGICPGAHAQDDGQKAVDRLRSRLSNAQSLQADFVQTFASEYFDEQESVSGTVIMQGSNYRVETALQVFVSDGVTTWIYDREEDQVLINDYVEDETTVSLNRFLFASEEEYRVSGTEYVSLNGDPSMEIRLESTDPASFFPVCTLFLRRADEEIQRLAVVDLNGTTITFDLGNVELNVPTPDGTFTFDVDLASDVVDLRSS